MHAILVTFRPEASEPEIMETMGPKMKTIASAPGLIMKTFVAPDPKRWGGFYLFATKENAEAYLAGEFYQWMSTSPLLSNVEAQHFHVEDEPSEAFGTPTVPLAESRAS